MPTPLPRREKQAEGFSYIPPPELRAVIVDVFQDQFTKLKVLSLPYCGESRRRMRGSVGTVART